MNKRGINYYILAILLFIILTEFMASFVLIRYNIELLKENFSGISVTNENYFIDKRSVFINETTVVFDIGCRGQQCSNSNRLQIFLEDNDGKVESTIFYTSIPDDGSTVQVKLDKIGIKRIKYITVVPLFS